jgi:hypothetical protein
MGVQDMKTDRSTIFAGFALMLLMVIAVNLGNLDLFSGSSTDVTPTESPPSAAPPESLQTVTPTLSSPPVITHSDIFLFDSNSFPSCFQSRAYEGMRAYSLDGKLHLMISSAAYDHQICTEQEFSNFIYETDVSLVDSDPADAELGLIFRYNIDNASKDNPVQQFYELTVRNNSASLYYYDDAADSVWTNLLDAVPVPVINVNESNHLKLIATGDILAIFMNDVLIGQSRISELSSGYVGVSLSNYGATTAEQHAIYENMQVYDLDGEAALYADSDFANGSCFKEDRGDWFETSTQDGQFLINVMAGNSLMLPCALPELATLTDFVLDVDVLQKTPGMSGVAFRRSVDTNTMYAFLVDPNEYVSLSFYPDAAENPVILTDLASSVGTSPLDEVNHLKVIASGDTIMAYVNSNLALQMQNDGAASGDIVFVAQSSAEEDFQSIFDNLTITSLVAP